MESPFQHYLIREVENRTGVILATGIAGTMGGGSFLVLEIYIDDGLTGEKCVTLQQSLTSLQ